MCAAIVEGGEMFLGSENAMLESERVCDYESEWDGYCMSESQSTGGRGQGVRLQWHQKLRRSIAIRIDMKCATASGTQRNSHTIVHSLTQSLHTRCAAISSSRKGRLRCQLQPPPPHGTHQGPKTETVTSAPGDKDIQQSTRIEPVRQVSRQQARTRCEQMELGVQCHWIQWTRGTGRKRMSR